uniref:Ankyrin repeat protein n=2 Tax=Acrobeloides nanus TaxID=290746 RepID=A0A914C7E6_9BILA
MVFSKLKTDEPTNQEIENSKWIDLTAQDEEGNSALILAVLSHRPPIVRLILEKAIAANKFNEVFAMVNKRGETAYSISLRNQTSECARVIEEMAELDRQQNGKKSRKHLRTTQSAVTFKLPPHHHRKMRRPKSEDAMMAADTSEIEAEFVEGFVQPSTIKEELAEDFIRRSRQASPNFRVSTEENVLLPDTNFMREKSKSTGTSDSKSQVISVTRPPAPSSTHPQAGVIISIGGKLKSLLKGSGDDKKRNVREYAVGSASDLSPSSSGLLGDELHEYLPPFSSTADDSFTSMLSPTTSHRPQRSLSANVVDDSQIAFDFSLLSTKDDSRESIPIPDVDENISRSSSVKSSKSMRNRAASCDARPRATT